MIVFNQLGNLGRLGNQLFQIAATIAHAKRTGEKYQVNKFAYNQYLKNPIDDNLDTTFDENFAGQRHRTIFYPQFHYQPLPLQKNLLLNGFFQSEKYFDDCKDLIAQTFAPSEYLQAQIRAFIPNPSRSCAIHIRRTDYVEKQDYHPVLPLSYYQDAMYSLMFEYGGTAYIFSDDIAWAKQNIADSGFFDKLIFSENNTDIFDLYAGAYCQHHIIANSTFSWWQAWLSRLYHKSGIHLAPKTWFGPKAKHDTKDLYFPQLIKMSLNNAH